MKNESAAAIALFAQLAGTDTSCVVLSTVVSPIFDGKFFTFTKENIHLDVKNRKGFRFHLRKDSGTPEIYLCFGDSSDLKRGDQVLFVKPVHGNSSLSWVSLGNLEKILNEEFIKVSRHLTRPGKDLGVTYLGTYEKSEIRASKDKFLDHDAPGGYHHHYIFERKKVGDDTWVSCEDPRGITHNLPTEPTLVEKVEEVVSRKTIPMPGTGTLKTAFELALAKYAECEPKQACA